MTICSDSGAQKIKSDTVSTIPHLFAIKWWDQMPWSLFSECWALGQFFHSPLSLSSRGFLVPLHFLPQGWCHLHIWDYRYFSQQSWFQLVYMYFGNRKQKALLSTIWFLISQGLFLPILRSPAPCYAITYWMILNINSNTQDTYNSLQPLSLGWVAKASAQEKRSVV